MCCINKYISTLFGGAQRYDVICNCVGVPESVFGMGFLHRQPPRGRMWAGQIWQLREWDVREAVHGAQNELRYSTTMLVHLGCSHCRLAHIHPGEHEWGKKTIQRLVCEKRKIPAAGDGKKYGTLFWIGVFWVK